GAGGQQLGHFALVHRKLHLHKHLAELGKRLRRVVGNGQHVLVDIAFVGQLAVAFGAFVAHAEGASAAAQTAAAAAGGLHHGVARIAGGVGHGVLGDVEIVDSFDNGVARVGGLGVDRVDDV